MGQSPCFRRETDQLVLEPMLQSPERGIRAEAATVAHHRLEQWLPSVRRRIVVAETEQVALLTAAPPDLFPRSRARRRRGALQGAAARRLQPLAGGTAAGGAGRRP